MVFGKSKKDKNVAEQLPDIEEIKKVKEVLPLEKYKEQFKIVGFTPEKLELLAEQRPAVEKYIEEVSDIFYGVVLKNPELKRIIDNHSTVDRLRQTLQRYVLRMFSGNIDETYIEETLRIGAVHNRVKLDPKWYLSAYSILQEALTTILVKELRDRPAYLANVLGALISIINFDMQLVLESYFYENQKDLQNNFKRITEIKERTSALSEELAASAEESSATVQNMNTYIQQIDDQANETSDFAVQVVKEIQEGTMNLSTASQRLLSVTEQLSKLDEKMGVFETSFENISGVLQVIREVSDQTNLLSLNASIEAARAGEAGRGFAIVAQEIKKLSTTTNSQIDTIRMQIEEISEVTSDFLATIRTVVEEITGGVEQNQQAKEMMDQIVGRIEKITEQFERLTEGISEVAFSANEMSEMVHQVATTAEHLSVISNDEDGEL